MQAHLETFPVIEAMKANTSCPFCYLYQQMEQKQLSFTLGGSVMEPDVRIQVNKTGICSRHHAMLYHMNNRLGHALLCDSHSKEMIERLEKISIGKAKRFAIRQDSPLDNVIEQLETMERGCVVCERIEASLYDYRYSFLHLWKTSREFHDQWLSSRGICLPHACDLLKSAKLHLTAVQQEEFAAEMLPLVTDRLRMDEQDLDRFIQKFDYRKQELPWENAKNALPRIINRLRGKILEE